MSKHKRLSLTVSVLVIPQSFSVFRQYMMYACGHPYSIPHSSIVQMNLNEPPTRKKGNIYTEFNFRIIIMWFFLLLNKQQNQFGQMLTYHIFLCLENFENESLEWSDRCHFVFSYISYVWMHKYLVVVLSKYSLGLVVLFIS